MSNYNYKKVEVEEVNDHEMTSVMGGGRTAEAMVGVAAMTVGIGLAPFGGVAVAYAGAALFFHAITDEKD